MGTGIDLIGRLVDRIMNMDNNRTFDRATDSLEAISLAVGGGPGVGLWMFGRCDAAMVASTTVITTDNLGVALPTDIFNNEFYMQVLHNADVPGAVPEREIRRILDFDGPTQTFTTDAFSANVEATDLVAIMHESIVSIEILGFGTLDTSSTTLPADSTRTGLYAWENDDYFKGCLLLPTEGNCRFQPRPIAVYTAATGEFTLDEPFSQLPGAVDYVIISFAYPYQKLQDILDMLNAILKLTETGGMITADGSEQNIYINDNPMGVYEPRKVKIDCSNMAWGDQVILRWYERIEAGGALVQKDERLLEDVQSVDLGTPPMKNIELEPNRFGVQVTLEQVAGAAYRDFTWEALYKV